MTFEAFVASLGFDVTALTETQKINLQAQWRKIQNPPNPPEPEHRSGFQDEVARVEAENARIEAIQARGLAVMREFTGDSEKISQIKALVAAAVADEKTTLKDFEVSMIRAQRWNGPNVFAPSKPQVNDEILEAAICTSLNLHNVDKQFSEQTLDAAHKRFKNGLGVQELYMIAAERNGNYRGSSRDYKTICEAAFPRNGQFLASSGPSSIGVTGILSNIGNKFIAAPWSYGEQTWRRISRFRTVTDFKTYTSYRLTGNNKFKKIPKGGEIKHGTLSEQSYTNQVEAWGLMLGIDYQDFRNDDLNAFADAATELGRGSNDAFNEEFWTEFLDDAAFFLTGNANYDDGDPDSVLSLVGLENADNIFAVQTKPDGTPLGFEPKILLVARAKRATALNLMKGTVTAGAQSTPTVTTNNVFEGMFEVASSVYLQSTAISGYSQTAWYLLADPNEEAVIETAFLDGKDTPTIETAEFDFSRLGMSMRAHLAWGIAKREYRAGVKLKGAA